MSTDNDLLNTQSQIPIIHNFTCRFSRGSVPAFNENRNTRARNSSQPKSLIIGKLESNYTKDHKVIHYYTIANKESCSKPRSHI